MPTRAVTVRRPGKTRKPSWLRGSIAILKGLWVTQSHFLRNLWGFIRRKPTVFTVQYPEQRLAFPPAFRGMPVLVQMDNGKERCVACGLCEWACPTDCITIFPAETADEIERYPRIFDIEMSRCMYCGLCEEACPEEAIVMSHNVEIAAFSRRGTLWHKEDLLTPVDALSPRLSHIRRGYERSAAAITDGRTNVMAGK
jgi:NADH-quinone oxidoreductase subunit I